MEWIVAIIALAGAFLNARMNIMGFVIWIFTNSYWIYHNIKIKEYPQAVLFTAFLVMAVYGLIHWFDEYKKTDWIFKDE